MAAEAPYVAVRDLAVGFGERVLQRGVDFEVRRGQTFAIVGESGTGKSALLACLAGLEPPSAGDVFYSGEALWSASPRERLQMTARFGVMPAGGMLLSSRTLLDNVALPLRVHTRLSVRDVQAVARLELALLGLAGYEHHYPAEVDAHRRVRAGLARATALDPDLLFLDEPTAGLDPWCALAISEAIIRIRDDLGATVVVASNDLSVVLAADEAVFLDLETKTMKARGNPARLRDESPDAQVRGFLKGGRP